MLSVHFRKKISLDKLNYWNVELQEPYFSYKEADKKREITILFPTVVGQIH